MHRLAHKLRLTTTAVRGQIGSVSHQQNVDRLGQKALVQTGAIESALVRRQPTMIGNDHARADKASCPAQTIAHTSYGLDLGNLACNT